MLGRVRGQSPEPCLGPASRSRKLLCWEVLGMSRGCRLDVWGGVGPGGCTGWPGWLCERARVAGSSGACGLSPRPGTLRAASVCETK